MPAMNWTVFSTAGAVCFGLALAAHAAGPDPGTPGTPRAAQPLLADRAVAQTGTNPPPGLTQTLTRIVVQDKQTRIEELRVGSTTLSITVQPKGDMPMYQVQPETGLRFWKVLGF
ncbi:MAG: hypothetical protein OHK0048_14050 [Rhodoferax sp.]